MSAKVKTENNTPTAEAYDSASGSADDEEDTGELDMKSVLDNAWMMRLPSSLWKILKDMPDDESVHIGHMRVWEKDNRIHEMRLRLNENLKPFEAEPKQYHLTTTAEKASNLYVFSEKDSGTFKPITSYVTYKVEKPSGSKGDGKRDNKFKGRMLRKSIPKNTRLVAGIRKEMNCHPVMNSELRRIRDQRLFELVAAETAKTTQIGGVGSHTTITGPTTVHGFIKPNTGSRAVKVQENKFTRMPQDQLLDEIGKCFQQFKYWRLKSLKQTLRQPEAYLKETLQKIAELVKTGPFANTWTLTPSMSRTLVGSNSTSKEEAAPEADAEDEEEEDGDEEEVEEEMVDA